MINFRKIASALTSAVMIGSTVGLAAAANYPAPFVQSGAASVAVVYGSAGSNTDLVAVTDITASLQAELAKQTATGGSASSGTSVSGGDFVALKKSSDNLNLGNTMSGVFGATVDDDDLEALLADGTYLNDENSEFDFEQKITLAALSMTHFSDSDYKSKEPTIGFKVNSNTFVMNYTIDFTTDTESDVTGGDLVDIETTDLSLLGKNYYVSDFDNSTLVLTLLDAANSGVVAEGETTTISVGDKSYDVSINFISTSSVKLDINGELTNTLAGGESYRLSDGTYVGVKEVLARDVAGTVGTVEFSLGTGKVKITPGSDVELNDDSISGVKGYIYRGTASGGKEKIDKIDIEWVTDEEAYITAEQSLSLPGFGAVKFTMGEFFAPEMEEVTVTYDGDDAVEMSVPTKDGIAKFNFLGDNGSGEISRIGGDAADEILRTSLTNSITFNESSDAYFVASYNTSTSAQSYLLSAKVDTKDNKNKTTLTNKVTLTDVCKDKAAGDTCNIGDVSLTISAVYKSGSEEWVQINASGSTSFDKIFTKTGLQIVLPTAEVNGNSALGAINASPGAADSSSFNGTNGWFVSGASPFRDIAGRGQDTYTLWFIEEDKDDNIAAGSAFNVTINDDSDSKLHVSDVDSGYSDLDILNTDSDTDSYVQSDLATKVSRLVVNDRGKAVITYHGSESFADVFLTAVGASVSSSGGSSGGSVKELGSVSVADSEISSVSGKNLIVVGGSCVNTVAAELIGASYPTCGSDWEASTGAGAGSFLVETFSRSGGKVATLVAGYNAGDTTNAAKYFTTQNVDTSVGKKYVGTSATSAELVTTSA